MNSKDLQKRYNIGTVTLYDAIALWMHSNEPCPEWLKHEYENALISHSSGGDFMEIMGFDLTKGRSTPKKRAQKDEDIKRAANLKYILSDLVEMGLKKVVPKATENNPMSDEVLDKAVAYLRTHNSIEPTRIYSVRNTVLSESEKSELKNKIANSNRFDFSVNNVEKEKIVITDNFKTKLKFMTAYEVAGLIFKISESKVRELERLYL